MGMPSLHVSSEPKTPPFCGFVLAPPRRRLLPTLLTARALLHDSLHADSKGIRIDRRTKELILYNNDGGVSSVFRELTRGVHVL